MKFVVYFAVIVSAICSILAVAFLAGGFNIRVYSLALTFLLAVSVARLVDIIANLCTKTLRKFVNLLVILCQHLPYFFPYNVHRQVLLLLLHFGKSTSGINVIIRKLACGT